MIFWGSPSLPKLTKPLNRVAWTLSTFIGLAAAALTTAANVPQVWKAWSTRETHDLSLAMTTMLAAGLALWVIYGLYQADYVIVIANSLALALALTLTGLKLRHG
ncbi:MAG: SemiSWEET transporter [Acidobacteria bacterium]|nr:SemiSWEET transporter [Acidobacteriota bacterium]